MRALVLALIPLAACWENADPTECRTDHDCSDAVCTRVGQCETTDNIYALRVEWTVRGQTTDQPNACGEINWLELSISEPSTGEDHRVAPVPCRTGSFFYDKIPVSYTDIRLTAFDVSGNWVDEQTGTAIGSGGVVSIALLP